MPESGSLAAGLHAMKTGKGAGFQRRERADDDDEEEGKKGKENEEKRETYSTSTLL